MLSLYLLRHAESEWTAPTGADHARPLNPDGRQSADRIGRFVARMGEAPNLVLVSSAARTVETLDRATKAGDWHPPIRVLDTLYEASVARVLGSIQGHGGRAERLLVVGHQPTLSHLVDRLTGEGHLRIVPGTLVRIDLQIENWAALTGDEPGELAWSVTPATC